MVLKVFAKVTAIKYKFYENAVDFRNETKIVCIVKNVKIVSGNDKLSVFQMKSNKMTKVWEIMVDDNSMWNYVEYNEICIICVTIKNE
ncbi:hypothetical protein A3Q56_07432 [Intoshia linei]|uniref:Uncharacterized protein n=1 Tax=Intoshia linei TaxID=1819745 RepID=A0A177ATZ3_9BILA|nr:hypothetical protein A3Q56_07432 [Intoshia linei]